MLCEMVMMKPRGQWRYGDLFKLSGDKQYEIIDGELYEMPPPNEKHSRTVMNLIWLIMPVARKIGGDLRTAPTGVFMPNTDPVQPDLFLLTSDQSGLLSERGVEGAPALVIEVLSPGNARYDRITKLEAYARGGVREYWLVSPEAETIDVLVLEGDSYRVHQHATGDDLVTSTVLTELSFPVSEAFEK